MNLGAKTPVSGWQLFMFALIFGLIGGIVGWAAFAAPHNGDGSGGGKTGSYSISISPAAPYTFGETVYTTTDAPQVSQSYIYLACYVNGTLVLSEQHANWSGGWLFNSPWTLGPSQMYGGGPSDCTMTVVHQSHNKQVTDAQTSFHIDG